MGEYLSKPSEPNPSSTTTTAASAAAANRTMTSSNSSEKPQPEPEIKSTDPSETLESDSPIQATEESPAEKEKLPEDSIGEENGDEEGEGEGEEEGECGFCLFMKAGGCRDTFTDWEKCVEESENKNEDIVENCFKVTAALKKCMEEHSDYYAPLLQAEKAAEEEAAKQLEEEKEKDRLNAGGDESSEKKETS